MTVMRTDASARTAGARAGASGSGRRGSAVAAGRRAGRRRAATGRRRVRVAASDNERMRSGGGGGVRAPRRGGAWQPRDDDDEDDSYVEDYAAFDYGESYTRQARTASSAGGGGGGRGGGGVATAGGDVDGNNLSWKNVRGPLLAGAFAIGLGAGVALTSTITFERSNIASTEIIDRKSPSNAVCIENGYSAIVMDQRVFVSFNPFNVYVSQPEVKPGCVLRKSNSAILEKKGIISSNEAASCKRNMNRFGYVGDLEDRPEASCLYHSEEAENQFMSDPRRAALGDGFRLRPGEEGARSTVSVDDIDVP